MELFLHHLGLVFEDLSFNSCVRRLLVRILVVVVPLFLERLKCFGHLVLNEKVSDEIVNHFEPLDVFRSEYLRLLLLNFGLLQP